MGIQSIQDFIDSSDAFSVPFTTYLESRAQSASNLLVVHVDSCIRQLYHEHIDWICGGQWNELLQSVNKFVRAFRQLGIELIVFFDGALNKASIHNWSTKHRFYQDIVRETLSLVINNQSIPFRAKVKNFVAPGALKSALRLAFRSFDVLVCTSLEDVYKEALLVGKDMRCIGTVGNDANLFLINASSYINIGSPVKLLKKVVNSCKVYTNDLILKELNLDTHLLPYLAALLGNFMVNDVELSSFYWELVEEDHPLKKIQVSMILEAVLPPSEVRLRCVAKFLSEKQGTLDDIDALAVIVFGKATNITVAEGKRKLKMVIDYYKDILQALGSASAEYKDELEKGVTAGGFPLPLLYPRYRSSWEYSEKSQLSVPPTPPQSTDPKETASLADDVDAEGKLSNPEDVIKQGTLEQAAQALIQLELNEAGEMENDEKENIENAGEKIDGNESVACVVHNDDEKPKVIANDTNLAAGEVCPTYVYPREIHVVSVVDTLDEEVLKTARERHQSGQMCPEVLNLLLKKEIVLDLAIDEEACEERLPIPLIFRPIRQLVYGILFEVETTQGGGEEQSKETLQGGIVSEEKCSDGETEVIEPNDEAVVNGSDSSDPDDEPAVPEKGDETIDADDTSQTHSDVCSKHVIKEWCIYSGRTSEEPDSVEPKGMNWDVPPLKKLWFGMSSEDDSTRLKAFLSCMKSDTANMCNTAMVPQRLMILCCVLRYLIQQERTILTKHDIDAFLAQALSTQLTLEHVNSQNLANIKLTQIDARCVKLAAIFMSGVENAIIANDACGSPVPWEFCCPWNFFDGKLFHSKWLQSSNMNTKELCEGKDHVSEKLERLRWCIVEGLEVKITGLSLGPFNPLPRNSDTTKSNNSCNNKYNTNHSSSNNANSNNSLRNAGRGNVVGVSGQPQMRARSRGAGSKRAVHGSGGTLHVAGVPVAHWHGNKAGVGYSKNAPGVLVGGPNSVDLPSNHPTDHRRGRGRGGMGRASNRGRGLLQTPFISPWQQGFGLEEYVNNTYQRYMKGVKQEQLRNKQNKVNNRYQVFSSRTRNQSYQGPTANNKPQGNMNSNPQTTNHNWFGKGRGKLLPSSPEKTTLTNVEQPYGRGQWINTGS